MAAGNSTVKIAEGVCLTATLDILRAIAKGAGPRRRCWRWAAPVGRRASWRAKSSPTPGWSGRWTAALIFDAILPANTIARWLLLGVSAAALSPRPATPERAAATRPGVTS